MTKTSNKKRESLANIVEAYHLSHKRLILLDYDGTIVSFVSYPDQAKPSARAMSIIKKLATDSDNTIVIISGRDKSALDKWLGRLPIWFVAEHGAFEKQGREWRTTITMSSAWKDRFRPIMQSYLLEVPGSLLEEKETALVFHYRDATNQDTAIALAEKLFHKLEPLVNKFKLVAQREHMSIEIRQGGANKGTSSSLEVSRSNYDFIMCAGDGETDEDMFKKLAGQAFCVKIGPGKTAANYRLNSPKELIDLLAKLAAAYE
jgi:trehalose 6-phosphate synthase/phosphatase